ncbi:unnamed protein product, partial [Acanthocheilonema viteae]
AQTERTEALDLSVPKVSEEGLEPYDSFIEEVSKGQGGSSNRPIQRVSAKRKLQSDVRQQITTDSKRRKMNDTEHKKIHTSQKLYNCSIWGRNFTQSSNFGSHVKTHTDEKRRSCLICGKSFLRLADLRRHMNRYIDKKLHSSRWNESFSDLSHLKKGTMNDTDGKPYGCSECGERFALPYHLRAHMMADHNRE